MANKIEADMIGTVFNKKVSRVQLVYFSGTGGTARIADFMEKELNEKGAEVFVQALDLQKPSVKVLPGSVDLLIIVYAVHAFDAPEPVYSWLKKTPSGSDLPTAVISVSAGGEAWPNTACRSSLIKALERKQFKVFYERMFVMPSNWMFQTKDSLAVQLMRVLPVKAESTVSEILSGLVRRTKQPQLSARALSFIAKLEKPCAKLFAKDLKVKSSCSKCGWCIHNCPRKNIELRNGKPSFGWKCVLCLRCIYGCPQNALESRLFGFIRVKEGYDLDRLEKLNESGQVESTISEADRKMFDGVISYLSDV